MSFANRITGFIFLRLLLCAAITILAAYSVAHGKLFPDTFSKVVVLIVLAGGLCFFAAVTMAQYIVKSVERAITGLDALAAIMKETAVNFQSIAEGTVRIATNMDDLANKLGNLANLANGTTNVAEQAENSILKGRTDTG